MQSNIRYFSQVSLVKIELQKDNLHQMNYWKVYILVCLIKIFQKVNMVGPVDKNVRPKRYGGPCKLASNHRKGYVANDSTTTNSKH